MHHGNRLHRESQVFGLGPAERVGRHCYESRVFLGVGYSIGLL